MPLFRSILVGALAAATHATSVLPATAAAAETSPSAASIASQPIDRQALVTRHHPHLNLPDPLNPFSVGNGHFAFTTDCTGLQSFPAFNDSGMPLSTQSDWGWHTEPTDQPFQLSDTFDSYQTGDRQVTYPTKQNHPAGQWLRANPHRLGLGHIGFELIRADGSRAAVTDLKSIDQTLELWRGRISSRFEVEGVPVTVLTTCDPHQDQIAVTVRSLLVAAGRLAVTFQFAYGSPAWGYAPEDWTQPERHTTTLRQISDGLVQLDRTLDADHYGVSVQFPADGTFEADAPHRFVLRPHTGTGASEQLIFSAHFWAGTTPPPNATSPLETVTASEAYWPQFWQTGGAIDFSGSTDPRAPELERRVVLSQYLMAIQCAGSMPPQETGLTYNSWYGKAHLEMHWWHGAHFPLWNRLPLLERSLPWYQKILPRARAIAERQGYAGARWPKMVGPDGNEGPSSIAPLLIWQQPHPIYFAELVWREHQDHATLETYREIVFATADFMASFALLNPTTGHYDLGPPLIPAQESYNARETKNPPFELAYWHWGLATAQAWRERLGLPRNPDWDRVLTGLAPYPEYEDAYATAEGIWNMVDHPSVLAAYGVLPGAGIDRERMRRTLHRVMQEQQWDHTWGWDYPMIAMTAARLGEPALALDALLLDVPKNTYLINGHNFQEPVRLKLYLPGNGGLLTAIAMMAAGWDDAPAGTTAPGFPQDGTWTVRAENLHRMP